MVRQRPADQRTENERAPGDTRWPPRTLTTPGRPSGRVQRPASPTASSTGRRRARCLTARSFPAPRSRWCPAFPAAAAATGGSRAARPSSRCPLAQSLWQSGAVDLVIWLTATTRASVLSGYAAAAAAVGSQFTGNADAVTARFLGWLRDTDRPWLVVLDDLTAAVALDDGFPWPAGAGRPGPGHDRGARVPVRAGRARRPGRPVQPPGIAHLPDRPADHGPGSASGRHRPGRGPGRRAAGAGPGERGDRQLGTDVPRLPRAFRLPARPGGRGGSAGGSPAAGAITWSLSVDHADLLSPGTAQSLLVLTALLDGNAIPSSVLTANAAREYATAAVGGSAATARQRDDLP